MKRLLIMLTVLAFITSCGSSENEQSKEAEVASTATQKTVVDNELTANPIYQKGHELTEKYMCLSCHKVDETLTGPAYKDVAKKYTGADGGAIAKLAKKIIDGGAGVWGEIPMSPHPNVSNEDAKAMVEYILLLK